MRPRPPLPSQRRPGLRAAVAVACLGLGLALSMGDAALAQGASVSFGKLRQDTSLPVEVEADRLEVDQANGAARLTGNVTILQGTLRLTATEVAVDYAEGGGIARLTAKGDVLMTDGTDAVRAAEAVYTLATGVLELTGDVVLTQGSTAISGGKLVVDLRAGTGTMEGRVRTVFQPGAPLP